MDWDKFYDDKEKKGQIKYTIEDGQKRMYSPTGEPLLLLCIKNESTNRVWPLTEMLTNILESGNFAASDKLNGNPLNIALENNCFDSISIMKSKDYGFDYQMPDHEGISFLGYLVRKLQGETDEQRRS